MRVCGRRLSFSNSKRAEQLKTDFHSRTFRNRNANLAPLFTSRVNDDRPYINIELYGTVFPALLDSGASHSVIGNTALWILNRFKLRLDKNIDKFVSTADGRRQRVSGNIDIPICIKHSCEIINFFVVPSLNQGIILGSNFCKQFQLIMDYKQKSWDIQIGSLTIAAVNKDQESNLSEPKGIIVKFSDTELKRIEIGRAHV